MQIPSAVASAIALPLLASLTLHQPPLLAPQPAHAETSLPRLVYPGTYGNYCGPTPEVGSSGKCLARGWKGDSPIDSVDAACMRHDLSYCACGSELRANAAAEGTGAPPLSVLSVLTALRATKLGTLEYANADERYAQCVRAADARLISDGIRIRRASQRSQCDGSPFDHPRARAALETRRWGGRDVWAWRGCASDRVCRRLCANDAPL